MIFFCLGPQCYATGGDALRILSIDYPIRFACEVIEGDEVTITGLRFCPPLFPGRLWL